MNTERNTNQVETPHKIKDFNAIAHDAMIRKMAQQVLEINASSKETVNAHVTEIRVKLAAKKLPVKKIETNKFEQTINKINQLSAMARHCSAVAKVGA